MTDKFNIWEGLEARDAGMARVTEGDPEFKDAFHEAVMALPQGWIGQCEDIRKTWEGPPAPHANAWGACWNNAIRLHLLVELPIKASMTAVRSHGRRTHLYRKA